MFVCFNGRLHASLVSEDPAYWAPADDAERLCLPVATSSSAPRRALHNGFTRLRILHLLRLRILRRYRCCFTASPFACCAGFGTFPSTSSPMVIATSSTRVLIALS